jgi:peptidoglycan/xylan/chitin deacetylase (PgdA/CDA1 family)
MRNNVVLNFHIVEDGVWFEKVVLFLKKHYQIVQLSSFEDNHLSKRAYCHFTFDDGDKTFYQVVFPILKKYRIPATLFISPKLITQNQNYWFQEILGYDNMRLYKILASELCISYAELSKFRISLIFKCLSFSKIQSIIEKYKSDTGTRTGPSCNLNPNELNELIRSDIITLGAHSQNHPVLSNETDYDARKEIVESVTELAALTGYDIKYFAYPNGTSGIDFGVREYQYLSESKISLAFSTDPGFANKLYNHYNVPRIGITYGSILFLNMKLVLGRHWNLIRGIRSSKDSATRKEIYSLLRSKNSTE